MSQEKQFLTVQEAGRMGGRITREKYGLEFFRQIGKKGGRTTRERLSPEEFAERGRKGGITVREKYGVEFFSELGKKGWRAGAGRVWLERRQARAESKSQEEGK